MVENSNYNRIDEEAFLSRVRLLLGELKDNEGMTHSDVADIVGLTRSGVANWTAKSATYPETIRALLRLAIYCDVDFGWLVGDARVQNRVVSPESRISDEALEASRLIDDLPGATRQHMLDMVSVQYDIFKVLLNKYQDSLCLFAFVGSGVVSPDKIEEMVRDGGILGVEGIAELLAETLRKP